MLTWLICMLRGHAVVSNIVNDRQGIYQHSHDFCERCGARLHRYTGKA